MFSRSITRRAFSAVAPQHSRVAVIGAGCGGQSLAAQLARTGKVDASEITIYDPKTLHHYQPAYTMVGGGVIGDAATAKATKEKDYIIRPQEELLAHTPGLNWNQNAVTSFDPDNNTISLSDGSTATYDVLVVNPGL